jgi:hypothetical protein
MPYVPVVCVFQASAAVFNSQFHRFTFRTEIPPASYTLKRMYMYDI